MSNAHNLNEGRVQALRALRSVSARLDDILGEADTRRNESGALVNEEGLPIIDITEPIDEMDTPSLSAATDEDEMIVEDNYPEPISKVPPDTLAINRKHRDQILDLLEDEELREEQKTQQEHRAELEKKREAARDEMQKRMMIQGAEFDKTRQAKEMEKKMAKALINGLGESPVSALSKSAVSQSQNKKPKKTVTFSDSLSPSESTRIPARVEPQSKAVDWGDVIAGRLSNKPTSSRSQPMKMEVVERALASKSSPPPEPPKTADPTIDSDDETDPDVSDSATALESGNEDVVLSAHHHRELALEYHRRREALSSSAATIRPEDVALVDGHTNVNTDDWDTNEVPYEATLAHPPPKSPVSKFKSSLLNRSRSSLEPAPSSTFGASVLPPSAVSQSIKMGKLVDGNLVAGNEDEEEQQREAREEEEIRKLLLKSMEDYSGIAARVMGPVGASSYWANPDVKTAASSLSAEQATVKPQSKSKVSRFKMNRTQDQVPASAFAGPSGPASSDAPIMGSEPSLSSVQSSVRPRPNTVLSRTGRSSPDPTPRYTPVVMSNSPSNAQTTIIDSPPLAPPRDNVSSSTTTGRRSPSLRVADSAISLPFSTDALPSQTSTSTIIESPSFLRPAGSSPGLRAESAEPHNTILTSSMRPAKRVMTNVSERSGAQALPGVGASETKPQKVSRFKAERLGG